MNGLPHVASRRDLLKWVADNPNKPFDPNMVVALSTGHTTDWEWQAVLGQIEDLRTQGYITRLKQDAAGSTYWIITAIGEKYLHALNVFEEAQDAERLFPHPPTETGGGVRMEFVGGWEQLGPLGEGGQSKVFLVRSPSRVQERRNAVQQILSSNPWSPYVGGNPNEQVERIERLAANLLGYSRPDAAGDLGALKMFKIEKDGKEVETALGRLKNEVAVLRQNRPGLIKLLEANENERWVVTEYMPEGALDRRPGTYTGDSFGALVAFRSLVETVSGLHKDGYVHRDIKPANVFLASYDELALGDFGIVFIPDQQGERLTVTKERVGPRDYMPQWADLGDRLENVHTNFDVYMLGKLLWCMVSGRLKLPREYHNRPAYDIKVMFAKDPNMIAIDSIIKKCVVEEPDQCLESASELLQLVDEQLGVIQRGGEAPTDGFPRSCRICGRGQYRKAELEANVAGKPVVNLSLAGKPVEMSIFTCDVCHHVQFFQAEDQ
jgi:serine/threonine protein kinase